MKHLIKIFIFLLLTGLLIAGSVFGYQKLMRTLYPLKYSEWIYQYAQENHLPVSLVFAVIKCESSFDPDAKSSAGAIGLMQITPPTFDWAKSKYGTDDNLGDSDLYDPETNIRYGTFLIRLHYEEFGDYETAMAAYHAGRGIVGDWLGSSEYSEDGKTLLSIPYADTEQYVERVMKTQKTYEKLYPDEMDESSVS